jgi:hypothetical protein
LEMQSVVHSSWLLALEMRHQDQKQGGIVEYHNYWTCFLLDCPFELGYARPAQPSCG